MDIHIVFLFTDTEGAKSYSFNDVFLHYLGSILKKIKRILVLPLYSVLNSYWQSQKIADKMLTLWLINAVPPLSLFWNNILSDYKQYISDDEVNALKKISLKFFNKYKRLVKTCMKYLWKWSIWRQANILSLFAWIPFTFSFAENITVHNAGINSKGEEPEPGAFTNAQSVLRARTH